MSRFTARPSGGSHPLVESLEPRQLLAAFSFSTGKPDGLVATVSEPSSTHNGSVEFESADDFVLDNETHITKASFKGLLTGGATLKNVSDVVVEIYRVFPNDSDTNRTPNVPTRTNSPSDNAFLSRSLGAAEIKVKSHQIKKAFNVANSVFNTASITVSSGGDGAVTGREVQFDVTFKTPLDLPADHYFFVPQVKLADDAAAGAHFLWLSAPKPIVKPGKPFTPDLQAWMRDDPPLAPDWLRIGTDIIAGGTTFNAVFSLKGKT
jgi:hypothetical protein